MSNADSIVLQNSLQKIIKLNPFDSVVALKLVSGQFVIEMINEQAEQLKSEQSFGILDGIMYFGAENWLEIQSLLMNDTCKTDLMMPAGQRVVASIQTLVLGKQLYKIIILRTLPEESKKEDLEAAKHLYFVEQYVEPVVSLDLQGKIIYANLTATNRVEQIQQLYGQKLIEVIDEDCREQFETLFQATLEGSPMGMPQCVLKNHLFSEEPVYLKTFPTYWDGQVIGAHIVIKNVGDFFQDQKNNQFIAYQDELTGLLNRRALNEQWPIYTESQQDYNIALILVDLDRFKKFNESLGKQKADGMLAEASKRFNMLCNECCEIYRYNGDEFVFLVKYFARDEVEKISDQISEKLDLPFIVDEQDYFITASIGIATSVAGQLLDLDLLLHRADQALFYVKNHGRSHYRFYSKEMSLSFPNEALMEAHLRRAIEFNEFQVYFQPQLDLKTQQINSFEALIRWNNKKFGFVPPSQFIPLAESSDLIVSIGDWVLERVFRYQKEWREKGYRPVRVAINISPKQFKQERFVFKIEQLIQKYGVSPKFVELEITEGSMMNVNETFSILKHLKTLGVFVSIDDFGTGYSSLSYLKTYPIDIIKIDQSFIADIAKDEKNEAIIKAIILLSHNLGLEVIAEGVELEAQELFLKTNNCQKVQGYLYDKPLPVEKLVAHYFH